MLALIAADTVLLLHLTFIAFALFGSLLAFRWHWILYIQLPAAVWGIFVELTGRLCPLTYLENHFRARAGQDGYSESFVEHYLLPIIYPSGLTRDIQFVLAAVVLAVNAVIYGILVWQHFRQTRIRQTHLGHRPDN